MAKAKIGVELSPVDTRKIDASLARIQSRAKNLDFSGGAQSINKLSRPLGKITGQATEFQKSLEASNARVLAFGASVAVINKLSQAFGALVSNTIKVEATFAKINTILGGTRKELQQFGDGIFKVAQQTGTSFDQVAEGALELARQGLGVEESLARVSTALKLVRVSGIDSQKAVAGLTAAIKGFEGAGITVSQIADRLAEVDTKFAVSTEDLINGLERASASARVAGVSFDELLAVVTTVQERTQRGGAVIGNAFKTIFARLGRTDTLKTLENLGIEVLDAQGNVRSAIPLFKDLAVELDKLGIKSVEAGNIIQKVAGVRQRDILISLVEDLNSGQSQFAKALQVSATAAGALDSKNQKLNQTLEALINNLTVSGQKLASVLGELGFSEAAGDILKGLSSVVNKITDVLQGDSIGAKFAQGLIKGIGGILTGPGLALISAVFIKLFVDLTKFGASSLKSLLGINKAAQAQNTLQQSVLQTLLQNEDIQAQLLKHEGNRVVQEQILLRLYNEQAVALGKVQKIAASVSPGLFGAGFRGGERGVTRRGAGGYVAAEARDVSRGVGGASANSKVVSIPNFAFGGGKRGTMVANSSEYFVPNYAGGGDAIFNQNMIKAMGLPSSARKINAAGGFIPNFADVGRMSMSSVDKALGTDRMINPTNPKIRNEKAGLLRRKRELNKGKKNLGIPANMFAMIVPNLKGKNEIRKGQKGSSNEGLQFTVVGYKGLAAAERGVSNDEQLDEATRRFALDKAFSESKLISGGRPKSKKLKQLSNEGAISALSGAIFETAVSSLLQSDQFDPRRDPNARFDFLGDQGLDVLFNLPAGVQFIDAKIRNSPDMQKSMFGKMKKQLGRAASGFVPNFAGGSLEEAISREMGAGLPVNQIRINQSGKLRNAQNPMGLAVTNTRDEPTGAIPNFAKSSSSAAPQAMEKAAKSAEKFGTGLDNSMTKIFALQFALSGLTNTVGDQEDKFVKIGEELSSFVNTLLILQVTGFSPRIPGLGKGKGRLGQAFALGRSGKGSGLGALGRLATGAGRLVSVFGRFLPFIGTAILLFQGLSSVVKMITGKGLFQMVGEGLGLIATESEKFAERISEATNRIDLKEEITKINKALEPKQKRLEELNTGFLERQASVKKAREERKTGERGIRAAKKSNEQKKLEAEIRELKAQITAAENKISGITVDAEAKAAIARAETLSALETTKALQLAVQQRRQNIEDRFAGITATVGADGFERTGFIERPGFAGFGMSPKSQAGIDLARAKGGSRAEMRGLKFEEDRLKLEKRIALARNDAVQKIVEAAVSTENLNEKDKKTVDLIKQQILDGAAFTEIKEKLNTISGETLDAFLKQVDAQDLNLDLANDAYAKDLLRLKANRKLAEEIAKQGEGLKGFVNKTEAELGNLSTDVPARLAENLKGSLENTFMELAEGSYDSLGDAFLSIAVNFGKALQQEIAAAAAARITASIVGSDTGTSILKGLGNTVGNIGTGDKAPKKKNSGGLITGGSGVRDDVPAVLTGGEFVLRKAAVQKYGVENLEKMNSGKYTDQYNFIRDIEPTYAGGMFVPGTRGGGEIVGTQNMLAFAQQETTAGLTDRVSAGRISLEDQSTRLSTRGRFRESPARRALKSAQQQAFGLYQSQIAEDIRERERYKAEQKAREDQFKSAVIGAAVNAAMAGAGQYLNTPKEVPGLDGVVNAPMPTSSLNHPKTPPSLRKSTIPEGKVTIGKLEYLGVAEGYANGGQMPGNPNAMLMGGEYVMSGPAAASIGRSTLEDINAMRMPTMANGGSVGGASSKSKSAAGTDGGFNVTINIDNNGNSDSSSDSQEPEGQKLAKRIKEVVVGVINEEKRVSGSLFMNKK